MAQGYIQTFLQFPNAKNGSLYVYMANSTNLAIVYDPVNGNIISQPLSIDSDGYCQQFWVETENLYDLDVRTYLNQQAETRNNVSVLGGGSGAQGPQGPQGVAGPRGVTGANGQNGADGADGADGANGADGEDGVSLLSVRVDPESDFGRILYNKSDDENVWYNAGNVLPDGTGKVKTSSGDTAGYLQNKIQQGTGIEVVNDTHQLTINNSAPETYKTQASQYSTVKDFLNMIIEGTSGITVSTSADFNKIVLSGAGIGGSGFTPRGEWDAAITYNEGDGVWYYDDSVSPIINRYYVATATTTGVNPYTVGTGWIIMFSIDQLGDQMVKLDADDSTTSFLLDKIKAGDGIVFTRTVDAGGDYITVSGQQVFSVTTTNGTYTIDGLGNVIKFRDGVWTNPTYVGTEIALDHKSIAQMEGQTTPMFTATGLPKFDDYGHYMNASDPIEISDVAGLADAIVDAGDGKVSIETGDAKGYMIDKLSATGAVNMEISGTVGNEIMTVVGTGKIACEAYDPVGYAEDKIIAGSNITIDKVNGSNGKALAISADFPEFDSSYPIAVQYGFYSGIRIDKNSAPKIIGKSSDFSLPVKGIDLEYTFNTPTGVFYPQKSGFYILNFRANLEPSAYQTADYDATVILSVETSYDGVNWSSYGGGENRQSFSVRWDTNFDRGIFWRNMAYNIIVDMRDNVLSGNHRRCRLVLTHVTAPSGYNNTVVIRNPSLSFAELKRPQGIQGPQGPAGTVANLDAIPDVNVAGAISGQVLGFNGSIWTPVNGGGGGADTYTVKVDADDTTPSYLGDKIAAAAGSPLTVNVVGDTLILDAIESDITDPLIQTIGLMNENGTMGFTGNAFSSVYADGEWATGFGQNTSDAYYKVSTIGRGTINKVKFFVNSYNDVDLGIAPTGNYGAIRIGLFTLDGVCKGMTAWTRGMQTLGTNTLTMTPCEGQNLTLERNGEYWIGIVARGMQLISYNKAASGFDPGTNALRYAVSIRSSSGGADWSPNFWNSTGGGFIQVKVPCVFMASTES